jgi:hypothetical protein
MENGEWRMIKNKPTRMDFNSQFSILNSTVRACLVFINCLVCSMGRPSIRIAEAMHSAFLQTFVVFATRCPLRSSTILSGVSNMFLR